MVTLTYISICTGDGQSCMDITQDQKILNLMRNKMAKVSQLQAPLIVGLIKRIRFPLFNVSTQ